MGRTTKKLQVRDKFYILTNGRETEKNYFDLLKSRKSIFSVKVQFHNGDPLTLVKNALKITDANQIWCVFDVDSTILEGTFAKAITLAKENNIQIAFSNVAFEVWLLSHYDKVEKNMNAQSLFNAMNKLLKNKLKLNIPYEKADKNLLEKYFLPRLDDATTNAKIVHQKRIKEHQQNFGDNTNYPIWKWNSCTTVYRLIEALCLSK